MPTKTSSSRTSGVEWSSLTKLLVSRSITELSKIHLFIHICFKHLRSNSSFPSPTPPFSVWLINLPAVDGFRKNRPLASSAFWAGWGRGRGGGLPSPHIWWRRRAKPGARRRQSRLPNPCKRPEPGIPAPRARLRHWLASLGM